MESLELELGSVIFLGQIRTFSGFPMGAAEAPSQLQQVCLLTWAIRCPNWCPTKISLSLAEISHGARCHNHRSNHFFQGLIFNKHPTYTTIKPNFGWLWTVTVAGFNRITAVIRLKSCAPCSMLRASHSKSLAQKNQGSKNVLPLTNCFFAEGFLTNTWLNTWAARSSQVGSFSQELLTPTTNTTSCWAVSFPWMIIPKRPGRKTTSRFACHQPRLGMDWGSKKADWQGKLDYYPKWWSNISLYNHHS